MQTVSRPVVPYNPSKLDLMEKIWAKVQPEDKEDQVIACLMRMVHNALNASASSLLLVDEKKQVLYFKFASGPVGKKLKRLHIGRQSGIAGWIVQNGKPTIVNNPQKNASFYKQIDQATGFKTRSIIGVPIMIDGKVQGVIEALNKTDGTDFTKQDLRTVMDMAATAAITIKTAKVNSDLMKSYKGTVGALVSLADTKETSGGGHSRRVAEYALMGANLLNLTAKDKQDIEYAAILHDIGKLSISDEILNKTDSLSDEEWDIMRSHPAIGYNILKDIPFLQDASMFILCHHERFDGKGYPRSLVGEAIPIGARLIAVADAFDNMTTDHPYRKALMRQQALGELSKHIRTQFCPLAVKAFNAGFLKSRLVKQ
jgi:response regulator RpfG family c-di-GMP phosphodiesterase